MWESLDRWHAEHTERENQAKITKWIEVEEKTAAKRASNKQTKLMTLLHLFFSFPNMDGPLRPVQRGRKKIGDVALF